MYMQLRIRREIFNPNDFETHYEFDSRTRDELCLQYNLNKDTTYFYGADGCLIEGDLIYDKLVTAVETPAAATMTAAAAFWVSLAISTALSVVVGVGTAYLIKYKLNGIANKKAVAQSLSYTVRGSSNQARPSQGVGILLGRCNVCVDVAGAPYSFYDGATKSTSTQAINQLFCNGYAPSSCGGVAIETDSSYYKSGHNDAGNNTGYVMHIGDSPIDTYDSAYVDVKSGVSTLPAYYNRRVSEDVISQELVWSKDTSTGSGTSTSEIQYLVRTSPSNTVKISVGMSAPYGYYKATDDGKHGEHLMNYVIQYRQKGSSTWITQHTISQNYGAGSYHAMYTIDNLTKGTYEVRLYRVNQNEKSKKDDDIDASICDTLVCDFIQYDTEGNGTSASAGIPVKGQNNYVLTSLRIKASETVNGYIDSLYVQEFLKCRTYVGDYTETSNFENYWVIPKYVKETASSPVSGRTYYRCDSYTADGVTTKDKSTYITETNLQSFSSGVDYYYIDNNAQESSQASIVGMMNNPAAVLLYVLTDPRINPRPVSADKIDWISLREWYKFCAGLDDTSIAANKRRHWTCNAWVTDNMTVAQLAESICTAGRATLSFVDGKYKVNIDNVSSVVSQVFTPRNAWDMQESRTFDEIPDVIKVEFVNSITGSEENCYLKLNADGTISYMTELLYEDQYKVETVSLWGVTSPKQVQQLATYRLACLRDLTNKYTWKCGYEQVLSSVGDVVYLSNDIFAYSLGYGRITNVCVDTSTQTITGVDVDENMGLDANETYGITVRKSDGSFGTYEISQSASTSNHLVFTTPIHASSESVRNLAEGNLFIYGEPDSASSPTNYGGVKVVIDSIKHAADGTATITAIDYVPGVYTADVTATIPTYVSNISTYNSGASFNIGAAKYDGTFTGVTAKKSVGAPVITYKYGDSKTTVPPGDDWSSTVPDFIPGKWLWAKSTQQWSDGTSTNVYSVTYSPSTSTPQNTTMQYYISDSSTTQPGEGVTWDANTDNWVIGKFVWTRYKYDWGSSSYTYSTAIYDKVLTDSLISQVSLKFDVSQGYVTRSNRISGNNEIVITEKIFGHGAYTTYYIPALVTVGNTKVLRIPYSSVTEPCYLSMGVNDLQGNPIGSYQYTFEVIDENLRAEYLGKNSTSTGPTQVSDGVPLGVGDYYVCTCESPIGGETYYGKIMVCRDPSANTYAAKWGEVSERTDSESYLTILITCQNDVYGLTNLPATTLALYSNYTTFIRNYIGANKIELTGAGGSGSKGSISSEGYIYGEGGTFDQGNKGFYIDTDGNAEFVYAKMKNADISGEFTANAMKTESAAEPTSTIGNIITEVPYYNYSPNYTALCNSLGYSSGGDAVTTHSVTWMGDGYSKVFYKESDYTLESHITKSRNQTWIQPKNYNIKFKLVRGLFSANGSYLSDNAIIAPGTTLTYAGWKISDLASKLTANTFYAADGTYNGSDMAISYISRVNDPSAKIIAGGSYTYEYIDNQSEQTFSIPVENVPITTSASIVGTPAYYRISGRFYWNTTVYVDGSYVATISNPPGASSTCPTSSTWVSGVSVRHGSTVKVVTLGGSGYTGSFTVAVSSKSLTSYGFNEQGLWIRYGNTSTKLGTEDDTTPKTNSINVSVSALSLTFNSDGEFYWDNTNYPNGINLFSGTNLTPAVTLTSSTLSETFKNGTTQADVEFAATTNSGSTVIVPTGTTYRKFTGLFNSEGEVISAFIAKSFDTSVENTNEIKWTRRSNSGESQTASPNITNDNINSYWINWTGSMVSILQSGSEVYRLTVGDLVEYTTNPDSFVLKYLPVAHGIRLLTQSIVPMTDSQYDIGIPYTVSEGVASGGVKYRNLYVEGIGDTDNKVANIYATTINGNLTGNVTGTASGNLPLSGGTLSGTLNSNSMIKTTGVIFGYRYNATNNGAAFILDKNGSNYSGAGSCNIANTIRIGACDINGNWLDTPQQIWDFKGSVKGAVFN